MINGLTRRSHPCQVMADLMTFEEHRGPIKGKMAWVGDDNNVLASWVHAAERFNSSSCRDLAAARAEYGEGPGQARPAPSCSARIPSRRQGCRLVVTDTWVSMGDKDADRRHNL